MDKLKDDFISIQSQSRSARYLAQKEYEKSQNKLTWRDWLGFIALGWFGITAIALLQHNLGA